MSLLSLSESVLHMQIVTGEFKCRKCVPNLMETAVYIPTLALACGFSGSSLLGLWNINATDVLAFVEGTF